MAKKKATGKQSAKPLSPGTRVRIKQGVAAPEFPDVVCEGWTGCIADITGKRSNHPKYVIEWDEEVIANMPASYVEDCEQKGLYHRMACFELDEVEAVGD